MAGTNTPASTVGTRTHFIAVRNSMAGGTGPRVGPTSSGNPLAAGAAFGDPSLNQTFSGPGASFAQFGQMMAQRAAGEKQQAGFQQALSQYMQTMQKNLETMDPKAAFVDVITKHADLIHTLQQGGFDPVSHFKDIIAASKPITVGAGGSINDPNDPSKVLYQNPTSTNIANAHNATTIQAANIHAGATLGAANIRANAEKGKPLPSSDMFDIKNSNGQVIGKGYLDRNGDLHPVNLNSGNNTTQNQGLPQGATLSKPMTPGKWDHQDMNYNTSLSQIGPLLDKLEANKGASASIAGHVTGFLAQKTPFSGPQTKEFLNDANQLAVNAQALSGLNPRLRAAFNTMQNLIPRITNGEDFNSTLLPQLRVAYRQALAGFNEYLGAANKEIPPALQSLTQRMRADPDTMDKITQATQQAITAPGSLTKDQMKMLNDPYEMNMLPAHAKNNVLRQGAFRGDIYPDNWSMMLQQHPELGAAMRPEEAVMQGQTQAPGAAGVRSQMPTQTNVPNPVGSPPPQQQ